MTECSDPSAAPTAANIFYNLQQKCCQGLPVSLEPLQRQQNTPLSNLLHLWVQKQNHKEQGQVSGGWDTTTILLLAKHCRMLKAVWAGHCHSARTSPHSATSLNVFIMTCLNPFPSLTLQSARDLKVPSPSKRSKAFLV